jgi:hypothetical protein
MTYDIGNPGAVLTKIKPEYSNVLSNPTHFPGPLVCWITQVPLYYRKFVISVVVNNNHSHLENSGVGLYKFHSINLESTYLHIVISTSMMVLQVKVHKHKLYGTTFRNYDSLFFYSFVSKK